MTAPMPGRVSGKVFLHSYPLQLENMKDKIAARLSGAETARRLGVNTTGINRLAKQKTDLGKNPRPQASNFSRHTFSLSVTAIILCIEICSPRCLPLMNGDELDLEDQSLIRTNHSGVVGPPFAAGTPLATGKIGGNVKNPFGALLHKQQRFVRAPDDLINAKRGRPAAFGGVPEFGPIDQGAALLPRQDLCWTHR